MQSIRNFESIVIDGNSTDNSKSVIASFGSSISHAVSEPDSGIYNAMNKGIRLAQGAYCLFLNSGDLLPEKDTLRKIAESKPVADIVYGDIIIDNGVSRIHGKMPPVLEYTLFVEHQLCHQAFIKRSLFAVYGLYDETFRYAADYAFYLKTIVRHAVKTQYVPLSFAVFNTFGQGSNPENKARVMAEREIAKAKYLSFWQLWWLFRVRYFLLHKIVKPTVRFLLGEKCFARLKGVLIRK